MDLDFVSVHENAKRELGQYTAILTLRLVNNIRCDWFWFCLSLVEKLAREFLSQSVGVAIISDKLIALTLLTSGLAPLDKVKSCVLARFNA